MDKDTRADLIKREIEALVDASIRCNTELERLGDKRLAFIQLRPRDKGFEELPIRFTPPHFIGLV